jgi:hypothetical protein
MKIFISLPVSGYDEKRSRERADRAEGALSRAGHSPVNPFSILYGKGADDIDRLCCRLRTLANCDAIYLCEGWQFSTECRMEANFAREYGKQIHFEKQSLSDNFYFNR